MLGVLGPAGRARHAGPVPANLGILISGVGWQSQRQARFPLPLSVHLLLLRPPLPLHPIPPCRRKQAAAAARKDAKLQYVVISEKWDK